MPSKTKKKDTVSKNMGARYAPIERALRSTPHIIVCDVSGSQTPAPLVMAQFQTPQPEAPKVFFNPLAMPTSGSASGSTPPAAPQPSTLDASNTAAGMDANSTSEKTATAPATDDDSRMEWEAADSN